MATTRTHTIVDAFEQLFALLREIDACRREILFWADEGGVWELCIDWTNVLAGYAQGLSRGLPLEEARFRAGKIAREFAEPDEAGVMKAVEEVIARRVTAP